MPESLLSLNNGTIWNSDAVELVRTLPDASVDLVVTDPAYESVEKWRNIGTTTRLKRTDNPWFPSFPNMKFSELFVEFYRVLKPGSHLYMFCDEETKDLICTGYSPQQHKFLDGFEGKGGPLVCAGFKLWKALVWDKKSRGMGYHYPAQHEFIVFAEKVKSKGVHRKLNTNKIGDVIGIQSLRGKKYYPAEKPLDLVEILVLESSNENDVVLDPFCGSGTVGAVCLKHNRRFILGDILTDEVMKRLSPPCSMEVLACPESL